MICLISAIPLAAVTFRLPAGCLVSLQEDSSISTVANEGEAENVEYRLEARLELIC